MITTEGYAKPIKSSKLHLSGYSRLRLSVARQAYTL